MCCCFCLAVGVLKYVVLLFTSCMCVSIYKPIYLFYPCIHLSICLSTYQSIDLSIHLSICLSIYLSIYPSIYLSIYLSIHLSTYLPTYPCIDLSVCRCTCAFACSCSQRKCATGPSKTWEVLLPIASLLCCSEVIESLWC